MHEPAVHFPTAPRSPADAVEVAARVRELADGASSMADPRLLDEVLDLARDVTLAGTAALYLNLPDGPECLAMRPRHIDTPLASDVGAFGLVSDLALLAPRRHLVVHDAARLPGVGRALASAGVESVVHLVLSAPLRRSGSLTLFFDRHLDDWDDCVGALLRAVGTFALFRSERLLTRGGAAGRT